MADLAEALKRSRDMIEEALVGARSELAALRSREAELEEQIAQAEAALGLRQGLGGDTEERMMTLHEALATVLRENGNGWMLPKELRDQVVGRGLYRKRDGSPIEVNQVQARIAHYSDMFEKRDGAVRLAGRSPLLDLAPDGVAVFQDDDKGFFEWLAQNPEGYFINTERHPRAKYMRLHRPGCQSFKGSPELHWTRDYVKLCSLDRSDLERWAFNTLGSEITPCELCRP
jgi:hypothetical protein